MSEDRHDGGHADGTIGLLARAARAVDTPDQPWQRVSDHVQRRRRSRARRRAAATGGGAMVLALAAVALALPGLRPGGLDEVVGGLPVNLPEPWPTGTPRPLGLPASNSTATAVPIDPAFDYLAGARTYVDLWTVGPTPEQDLLLARAEETARQECLAPHGIVLSPLSPPDPASQARALDVEVALDRAKLAALGDPDVAARDGYGIAAYLRDREDDTGGGGDGPPPQLPPGMTIEEFAVLDGGTSQSQITVDMGEALGVLGVSGDGCTAQARRAVYGDLEQWLRSQHAFVNMASTPGNAEWTGTAYDPEMHRATTAWAQCMSAAGYRGLHDRADAWSRAWDGYGNEDPDAGEHERAIAVADAECVRSTGYLPVWEQTQDEVIAWLKADPDIRAWGAIVEAALPRAEAILADAASGGAGPR